MRIEGSRFGVKTSKTIRRAPANGQALNKAQNEALKQSQKSHPQVELVNGKLMKSANNFEKVNKKERKRQLTEAMEDQYQVEADEQDFEEEEQYMVEIVDNRPTKASKRRQDEEDEEETKSESDEEDAQSTQSNWLEAGSESEQKEIREILFELAQLQRIYAKVAQEEIPEDDLYKIKALQRSLDAYKPVFKNLEGNSNRIFRAFSLEKLSGFMSAQEFQRKYLQTGAKQGKFMLKGNKHSKSDKKDAAKAKNQKKKALQQEAKQGAADY
jgi:hypothetical protein